MQRSRNVLSRQQINVTAFIVFSFTVPAQNLYSSCFDLRRYMDIFKSLRLKQLLNLLHCSGISVLSVISSSSLFKIQTSVTGQN